MRLLFLCALVIISGGGKLPSPANGPTLKKVAEFDLPGPPGKRFDYLTIDVDDHYLISTHLAARQTYVIDLVTNKVVATVADTPGAEGVEYVPEFHKFYTSNTYDNTIGVVDLQQMKVRLAPRATVSLLRSKGVAMEATSTGGGTGYGRPRRVSLPTDGLRQ
jgi:DNA-binding beta-propeller fold protein YncE